MARVRALDHRGAEDFLNREVKILRQCPPRVVLYLGAGASHFAGYKTFADFPALLFNESVREAEKLQCLPDNAKRLLEEIRVSLLGQDGWTTHDRFLWRLHQYQQILDLNLSDPALQPFLRPASASLFELSHCTTAAANVMAQTTVRHYSSDRVASARTGNRSLYANMQRVYGFYTELATLNSTTRCLPVFTTNYDMLVEDLCREFGKSEGRPVLANGFPHVQEEGEEWAPGVCDGACESCSLLQYFRLHGCACWFYAEPGNPNVYYHRTAATLKPISNLCAMYPGLERERGAGPHGYGFRSLYGLLEVCELVIFVGFSFRDDDVMHVLLKALADRKGRLKILVVDNTYTAPNVRNCLKEAARRSTFPARVPDEGVIENIKLNFGIDADFDETILERCKQMLKK